MVGDFIRMADLAERKTLHCYHEQLELYAQYIHTVDYMHTINVLLPVEI